MPMIRVPAGEFAAKLDSSGNLLRWYLPVYYMDAHEVTNEQFARFRKRTYIDSEADLPAVGVTPAEASAYAEWAGGSMPSVAHLEKAAAVNGLGIRGDAAEICSLRYKSRKAKWCVYSGTERWTLYAKHANRDKIGFRCIIEPPAFAEPHIEWRRDFWDAFDEARRRNTIIFLTLHWDACGNCDRYRQKITSNTEVIQHMNQWVVSIVGNHYNRAAAAHAGMPNGFCAIFPGVICEEHRGLFQTGLHAIGSFPMSPGHAILDPRAGECPTIEELVIRADKDLPDEGTIEYWIDTYKQIQKGLGSPMSAEEYERQRGAFEDIEENPTREALRPIAGSKTAAFREEASILLAELGKPETQDSRVYEDGIIQVSGFLHARDWKGALSLIRKLQARKDRNPLVLELRELHRALLRVAWRLLGETRYTVTWSKFDQARKEYQNVIDQFPDTRAAERARLEMEQLP